MRTAFHRQAPTDRVWIREVHLEPLELIVSDDRDGTIVRVPVTVSASGAISFGKPQQMRMEYVRADTSKVDASKLVYASAADSRAGNGTRVHATTITSRKEPAAMPQPNRTKWPNDLPREPGEDIVSWAIRSGRVLPGDQEQHWRGVAASAPHAAESVLTSLSPGTARPLTATGRLHTVAAAVPSRPAGIPAHWFAANPLVDRMRQVQASVYADAVTHGGPVPTLFGSGDLPAVTASGIDPQVLAAQPWPIRHPLASATTVAEAEDILADAADQGEHFHPGEWMNHEGNVDYGMRVSHWGMRAIDAAAAHRRDVEAQAAWQSDKQVAAAVEDMSEEEREDLLFDPGPVMRHLEGLRSIASGGAVRAGMTQVEARRELEKFARGEAGSGRWSRVPAAAAQAELDKLDRQLGRTAAAAQIAAAAAERGQQ